MIKDNNSTLTGWQGVISALVLVLWVWPRPAYCQPDGTALLLQQTPLEGGSVTPAVGVHYFDLDTEVTLTAIAKPGYQFIYWLGDVSDPTANSTIVYLDAPKIVIAVFERAEFEFLAASERAQSRPGGGLIPSAPDYARRAGAGGGGRRPEKWRWPEKPGWPEKPEPEDGEKDFPVPEEKEDFPVPEPIPEPATIALLGLGGLALLRKRRE